MNDLTNRPLNQGANVPYYNILHFRAEVTIMFGRSRKPGSTTYRNWEVMSNGKRDKGEVNYSH